MSAQFDEIVKHIESIAEQSAIREMSFACKNAAISFYPDGGVPPEFSEKNRSFIVEQTKQRAIHRLRAALVRLAFPED